MEHAYFLFYQIFQMQTNSLNEKKKTLRLRTVSCASQQHKHVFDTNYER